MLDLAEDVIKKGVSETAESRELFVGLDLGTSQSALATSGGRLLNIASVVGVPKDFIAKKLLKKEIIFGDECLRNRMSVDLFFPLRNGVIVREDTFNEHMESKNAALELIRYLLSRLNAGKDQKVYLVVGTPAQASLEDKRVITEAVKGLVESVLVVSEPFLVSYGLGIYGFALIVDIGAGTLDICRMHGTLPDEDDQKTLYRAGNHIDEVLFDLLKSKIPNARNTIDLTRRIKEQYASVDKRSKPVMHDFFISGKAVKYDITHEIKEAVMSIFPDMFQAVRELITGFEPEYQHLLQENIVLAGCGSRIRGIETAIEKELSDLGAVRVTRVDDPVYAGAIGGLKLAQDMPAEEWQRLQV